MEITYLIIISIITYICGAITKMFTEVIPSKYIPIQNVFIGIVSGLICYFTKIEPNLFVSLVLCLLATMSAGGTYDLAHMEK